jgi:glutathione S-transferase
MNLTLYHSVESTCAQKVRFVLSKKGLDWVEHRLNLRQGEQFDEDYLKLNPKAVVPTLVHNGKAVRESSVIAEYIDDTFPDPPLRPADAFERAQMRLVMKAFDEEMHPGIGILSYAIFLRHQMNELKTPEQLEAHFERMTDPARRDRQQSTHGLGLKSPSARTGMLLVRNVVSLVDKCLANGKWLAGDEVSLADCSAIPYMVRTRALGLDVTWKKRPHISAWMTRAIDFVNGLPLSDPWGSDGFRQMLTGCVEREASDIQRLLEETA